MEISNSPIFLTPIWLSIKIDGSDVFEEDISEEVIEDHNNDDIIERPQDILKEHVDNDNNIDDENNNEVGNSSRDLGLKILANLKSPILLEISKTLANNFGDLQKYWLFSKILENLLIKLYYIFVLIFLFCTFIQFEIYILTIHKTNNH